MFEYFTQSLKGQLYDRASSPIIGCFILSWTAINHKFLAVFFSGETPKSKLDLLDALYTNNWELILWWLIIPGVSTGIFLLLYPPLSTFVYSSWVEYQKDLLNLKKQSQDQTILTEEDRKIIYADLARVEEEYKQTFDSQKNKIDALLSENHDLKEKLEAQRRSKLPTGPDDTLRDKVKKIEAKKTDFQRDQNKKQASQFLQLAETNEHRNAVALEVEKLLSTKSNENPHVKVLSIVLIILHQESPGGLPYKLLCEIINLFDNSSNADDVMDTAQRIKIVEHSYPKYVLGQKGREIASRILV